MGKNLNQKFSVTLSNNMLESLRKLAASKHITQSELIRQLVQKGLTVESYTSEQDVIRGYIREEIETTINAPIDRIIRLILKSTEASSICMFACICMLSDVCADEADFENILANALKRAHKYMKQKEQSFEHYILKARDYLTIANELKHVDDN
ncbi:MAG: ribbon-helix-helix protein, CopG family [Eubacterium sp.]|jgi:hypothetical protein|nr:ribbon-helix-helix protein, CopG family [Eubacterium sp.]